MGQGGFWRGIIYDPVCQPALAKSWPGSPLLLEEGRLAWCSFRPCRGHAQICDELEIQQGSQESAEAGTVKPSTPPPPGPTQGLQGLLRAQLLQRDR